MSSIGTGYDLYTSQFSPDGRIFQIDYAAKAVENCGTAVAIRASDGVVVAVEKIISSKLYERHADRRIFSVDRHIGLVVTGLLPDGRALAEYASNEAANYRADYGSSIPCADLAQRLAAYMHVYTLYSAVRPFGVTVFLVAYDLDDSKPQLFAVETSGQVCGYWGVTAGKAMQAAKTQIEKLMADHKPGSDRHSRGLKSCRELAVEAAKIIMSVNDVVKDKLYELELSWVCKETGGRHVRLDAAASADIISKARIALQEDSSEDEEEMAG